MEQVSLKVVNAFGGEVYFKIRRNTALDKLMDAYCKKQGVSRSAVRFLFDGSPLDGGKTPDDFDMDQDDVIDAMIHGQAVQPPEDRGGSLDVSPVLMKIEIMNLEDALLGELPAQREPRQGGVAPGLWEDRSFCDGLLVTDDGVELAVHRAVLANASEVFAKMFAAGCEEGVTRRVNIEAGVPHAALEALAKRMYCGPPLPPDADFAAVLHLADQYERADIAEESAWALVATMTPRSAVTTLAALVRHSASRAGVRCALGEAVDIVQHDRDVLLSVIAAACGGGDEATAALSIFASRGSSSQVPPTRSAEVSSIDGDAGDG